MAIPMRQGPGGAEVEEGLGQPGGLHHHILDDVVDDGVRLLHRAARAGPRVERGS